MMYKINHIRENDAIATQVRGIASKQILNIISFGADDARSEFNAQSIIRNEASNFLEYKDSLYKIHFKAPLYYDKPFIRVQDPKHVKKTARNQTFSGVRHISLGIDTNCITYFHSNTLMQISVSGTLTDDLFVLGQLIIKRALKCLQKSFISIQSYDTTGIINTNRERNSAAGYVFDIDGTKNDRHNQHNELNELMNLLMKRSSIIGNVALEISRILSDSQNENDQLYEENLDDDENKEVIQQLPSVGEFPDIQYIIQHPRPIPITFHPFQQFFTDDIFNITILLQIHQSHDAFSRNLQSNS
ncbi:unnamed protein product [Rhizophagus irregularis]|nr:unnamed protein product [Rhizophagus irregularis]